MKLRKFIASTIGEYLNENIQNDEKLIYKIKQSLVMIYDFSKGTLSDYINWDDVSTDADEWRYN
jgi:hypothetical protein